LGAINALGSLVYADQWTSYWVVVSFDEIEAASKLDAVLRFPARRIMWQKAVCKE
jgi:hypothetical protein